MNNFTCACGATVKIHVYSEDGACVPECSCLQCGRSARDYIGYHDRSTDFDDVVAGMVKRHNAMPRQCTIVGVSKWRVNGKADYHHAFNDKHWNNEKWYERPQNSPSGVSLWLVPTWDTFELVS